MDECKNVGMDACMYGCMHACMYAYLCVCTYVNVSVCMRMFAHVCIYIYAVAYAYVRPVLFSMFCDWYTDGRLYQQLFFHGDPSLDAYPGAPPPLSWEAAHCDECQTPSLPLSFCVCFRESLLLT